VIGRTLVTLLLLLVGFTTGSIVTGYVIYAKTMESMNDADSIPAFIMARLNSHFDLTDQQKTDLRAVLTRHRDEIHLMLYQGWPYFVEPRLDSLGNDIRFVLKGEQKAEWDRVYSEVREKYITRPAPPPGHGPAQ